MSGVTLTMTTAFARTLMRPGKRECRVPLCCAPPAGTVSISVQGEEITFHDARGSALGQESLSTGHRVGAVRTVQEPWACDVTDESVRDDIEDIQPSGIRYEADRGRGPTVEWRAAGTMPLWASRVSLVVTDVRIERLQSIKGKGVTNEAFFPEFDVRQQPVIRQEGRYAPANYLPAHFGRLRNRFGVEAAVARAEFAAAWDEAYGRPGQRWEDDPFVIVLAVNVIRRGTTPKKTISSTAVGYVGG